MAQKRYAIVRVDNRCPVEEEEDICLVDRIKMFPCFNDKRLSCKNCRYGDTKEHMVKKITQVLTKETGSNAICIPYERTILWEEIAEKIVKFLGVEE